MGRIAPETIELVAAANDIVEVIGAYFPVRRAGSTYRALCPFHNEKTPSFHINPARQSFHCFGCNAGGSVFRFVMDYENLDFVGAIKRLAERANIPIVEEAVSAAEDSRVRMRKRLLALHQEAAAWFHHNLLRTPAAAAARDYLKHRGLNKEIAVRWTLGYAPDSWEAFGSQAAKWGYNDDEIVQSGLVGARDEGGFYDRFRDRLMFPICNDTGGVIAFSGRVLGAADTAKYVNSPETMLFTKGNVLFGLHASKRDLINAGTAIVCEGQIDLISAFEAGVKNVVAPQGTAFTQNQARILKRFVNEVVLCFDSDAAGEKAAERSLAALLDQGLLVRVAAMPAGEDPDSVIRSRGAEAFQQIIRDSQDFFDDQIGRLPANADLKTRQNFARKMAGFVVLLDDPVQREDAMGKIISRLGLLRADFEKMLPRKSSVFTPTASPELSVPGGERPNHALQILCLLAFRDLKTRDLIRQHPWPGIVEGLPGEELFGKIIQCPTDPNDTPGLAAFLSTQDADTEAFLAGLLHEKLSAEFAASGPAYWRDFALTQIDRKRRLIHQSMIAATAAGEDVTAWQKQNEETLDLKNLFNDIPRPSARTEDPF